MPFTWAELLLELRRADLLVAAPDAGPALTALTADSRAVEPGAVYIALRGSQADGHRFVPDAVKRGAAAVVVESPAGPGCRRSWCATAAGRHWSWAPHGTATRRGDSP